MANKPYHLLTDEELDVVLDAAMEQAKDAPEQLTIVDATYHSEPELDLFVIRVSDGRRLVIAREELQFVADVTPEQAADFFVDSNRLFLWWPKLDEGFRLQGLLEGRYGNERWMARSQQHHEVAA